MAMIYVRTRPGRAAYFEGKKIPHDKFVPVPDDPRVRRLIDHWGDLEVDGNYKPRARTVKAVPAPEPSTDEPKSAA